MKVIESLTYSFEQDIKEIKEFLEDRNLTFDDLFKVKGGDHPILFRFVEQKMIRVETYIIMDQVLNFSKNFKEQITDEYIYPNLTRVDYTFGDDYGFIKKYPNNWLYGADNTGDILSIENQKWYHNFAKDFNKFDLITGDAGLLSKDLELLQKIEYACICMISGTASIGSNCIMKHFTPHNSRIKNSKEASGFFVNYLYLYYQFHQKF